MSAKDQFYKAVKSISQYWDAQEKKRKITFIVILALIIAFAVILTIILNAKRYTVLFTGLESDEAGEIAAEIDTMGYDVTVSGGEIRVPEGTENMLTMSMAQLGYPKSSLTYELYTQNVSMFATESEKNEYIRMALEQRLGAIIGSLEDLNRAMVTLSIPPRSNAVITSNKQYPSASVVVYPKNDRKLSSKQIQGITNIVKASLPELTEENVLIADNLGFPLIAEDMGVDEVDDALRKLVFKNELERDIKNKIGALLTPAFNEDGFSAVVNMTLNFDSRVSEETVYTPSDEGENSGVKAHEENKEATGFQTDVGGVAGVEVGADNTYPTGELMGDGQWSEIDNSITYLVDTRKEQVEKAGYVIDGLSIAVVIYQDYLSDVQRDELVNLVGQAGGVNPLAFNDVITVANFPKFGESEFDDITDDTIIGDLTFIELIILGAVILGVIIVLAIILFVMSRNNAKKRKRFERMVMESGKFGDAPDGADNLLNISIDGLPLDVQSLTDDSVETKEGVIRREIAQFAKQSPEIVASLLKNWMKETEQ